MFALFAGLLLSGAPAAQAALPDLQLQARAAILMDAETGQVLYQLNADEPLPPASMAKMMTEYLVEKSVQEGKISWSDVVTVGDNAAKQIGSRVFLAKGDKHTVEELYKATAIASANDASVQLAEYIAGSEQEFVKLMNQTAREMGLTNTHFINATGLDRADMPEEFRPAENRETEMSARDAAMLAYHIIKEVPQLLETAKIPSLKFRERDDKPTPNWNWMLESNKDVPNFRKFAYPGVDGLKTGHTSRAGNNFTGTALRDGTRLIAVVMQVPGGVNDGNRFLETAKLFDYGFNNFEKKSIVEAKQQAGTLPVKKGKQKQVSAITASDITILVPKGTTVEIAETTINELADGLTAPIKAGDHIGTVTYKYPDPVTGETRTGTVDLLAGEDVEKANWFVLLLRSIGGFFSGLFKGIVDMF
jgi:D-alanyl-D-alanine carboxypeptidase (penicillin-binding protein 5/6)